MTKRSRLATFAISIVDNLCLLQQNKWNANQIINMDQISRPFPTFSSVAEKTGCCREVILVVGDAQKHCSGLAVAVRCTFKQESMYGLNFS